MSNIISFAESQPLKRADIIRNTIVLALVELVSEQGFAALTTQRIAQRAGVPLSLAEKYIGTKARLLELILQHCNDEYLVLMDHEALRDGSLEDRVTLLVNLSWCHCKTDLFLARIEMLMASRSHREASSLKAMSKQQAAAMRPRFRAIFPECRLDDRMLMESLVLMHSSLIGLVVQTLIEPKLVNIGGYLRRISRAMLAMLEAKNQL